jgi:hypothetical protein
MPESQRRVGVLRRLRIQRRSKWGDPGSSCANYADPQQICNDCAARGSPCDNGLECCWGTNDIASPAVVARLATWTCIEARVQANSGAQANGSQTLWVDGAQVGEWQSIRFRTDDALKINSLGLWHYVTDDVYATGQTEETLWFDDVVVSTAPIGCGAAGSSAGEAGADAAGGSSGDAAGGSGASMSGGSSTGGSGTGGAAASRGATSQSEGGCGCRASQSRTGGLELIVMAAVMALVASRRR